VVDFSKFIPWERTIAKSVLDDRIPFNDIFVVTSETICCSYFYQLYNKYQSHLLITGKSGTGKSKIVMNEIHSICANHMNKKLSFFVSFFAKTNVKEFQAQLKSWLTQRIKQGRYGPPENKSGIILIEDINMPAKTA